jgi:hypothetical protein
VFTNSEQCRGHRLYQRRHARNPESRTTAAVLVEHCVGTSAVDNEEFLSSPLENATTPSGFIDRSKMTSSSWTLSLLPFHAES